MKREVLLLLTIIILIPIITKAEWIPLSQKNASPAPPNVTLISDDNNSTVLKIEIYGFEQQEFISGDRKYQIIDLLTESFTADPGFPEIPYVAKVLAIPDQSSISVEVIETGKVQTFKNIYLPPARESWLESSPEPPYTEIVDAYNSGNPYPNEWAQWETPAVFRDFRITRVSVFPVRYIPASKELQVVSSITVRIKYGSGEVVNPKISAKKPIAPSFGDLYQEFIFNYQSVLNKDFGGKESGHELMLCIMPDAFVANFQTYSEWKRRSGIDIHITKFSDIGANATNPNIIKNHISDAYYNWEVPPTYVLIVGDNGVFPHTTANGYVSENFFVEIDGNDYFPDLLLGRFTNESDYGMQVMINKMIKYEKTPFTTNNEWFKKGICCSNNAYPSQAQTKRFAAQRMLLDGGFISVDTMMMPPSGCPYTLTDVKNAINNGRSFLNYRGEGWYSGWWAGCYQFGTSDVTTLANGEKFTFVTSIGCGVANFTSTSTGNCFGEEWMEIGTLSNSKGAAAFVGPTGNTHTAYNNNIDRGIYKGMFQEGLETPGQALLRGKLYMYNVFGGGDSYVSYHFKIYCILGDPSIHIWKDIPKAVTVNYPASIPFGNNLVLFTVTHSATGLPVENAMVCVTGNSIFSTCSTDANGNAYLEINSVVEETLKVTVRGGNVIPFLGTMEVLMPTGPYIIKDSYTINDMVVGNGNGLLDYGETNLLSLTVKNVGFQQANNVVVSLNTNDTFITLTDNTAYYGSIAAGSTSVVTDGFAYLVAGNIPDEHLVLFEVTATSGSDTWVSYLSIMAHAPVLEYMSFILSDPAGNNNGKLDPGETADISITIKNSGSSGAWNVTGTLLENDPFVTINSSQMNFGNIAAGALANAVYSVSAASSTPTGHNAIFTLDLNADLGITGTGSFQVVIGQIPVLIVDLDDNGNSAPSMETALNIMDISYETLYYLPSDLNLYSTIFVCLGIYPMNHVLTFSEGQSLTTFLNNGGSLYMEGGDTWYFDPDTPVHSMFNINPTADGSSDMNTVLGKGGTFTSGMSFAYNGENSWMDHIEPIATAYKILENQSPLYGTGVAYDAGGYKTIGTSHEFGGLSDGASPSTKAELMAVYLQFFGISNTLQAIFNSNVTIVCENSVVNFFDQSSGGNIISWEWTFEGGYPATSYEQNPSVLYSIPGSYDVSLTVSNGTENSTLVINDYILVSSLPVAPPAITGATTVCASQGNTNYSTAGLPGISTYYWLLEPANAGYVSGTGLTVTVIWANGFIGEATLKVAGQNICGTGAYSNPVNITRYLPEVTLEPFDWVCVGWPAFELTGGWPAGGEYSGPGVANGWFDPTVAGTGTHNITYSYSDPNGCVNSASESIVVDPCTGMNDEPGFSVMKIYPNPTTGMLTIDFAQNTSTIEILVMNSLNEVVYNKSAEILAGNILNIDLSNLVKGIYFIKLKTTEKEEIIKIILQ